MNHLDANSWAEREFFEAYEQLPDETFIKISEPWYKTVPNITRAVGECFIKEFFDGDNRLLASKIYWY